MNDSRHNLLLLAAVVLLAVLPLGLAGDPAPGPDGTVPERFAGADDRARELVGQIAPGYRPWFAPILEPAGPEVATLLFALQAALGAGFIGYYLGTAATRRRLEREAGEKAETGSGNTPQDARQPTLRPPSQPAPGSDTSC